MINLALSDDEMQTLLGSLSMAAQQFGMQLQQAGLGAVDAVIPRLQAIVVMQRKLERAVQAKMEVVPFAPLATKEE